jgi:hypothetical protein
MRYLKLYEDHKRLYEFISSTDFYRYTLSKKQVNLNDKDLFKIRSTLSGYEYIFTKYQNYQQVGTKIEKSKKDIEVLRCQKRLSNIFIESNRKYPDIIIMKFEDEWFLVRIDTSRTTNSDKYILCDQIEGLVEYLSSGYNH